MLVLGSLPGEASLAAGRYYAHPQNRFWHLVGAVIGRADLPSLGYEARLAALLEAGVGLWDTIGSARREGSLDSAIRDVVAAPLRELVGSLPNLRAVGFNGRKSAAIGRTALAGTRITLVDLPSSSPAHAALTHSAKQEKWLALREYLVLRT